MTLRARNTADPAGREACRLDRRAARRPRAGLGMGANGTSPGARVAAARGGCAPSHADQTAGGRVPRARALGERADSRWGRLAADRAEGTGDEGRAAGEAFQMHCGSATSEGGLTADAGGGLSSRLRCAGKIDPERPAPDRGPKHASAGHHARMRRDTDDRASRGRPRPLWGCSPSDRPPRRRPSWNWYGQLAGGSAFRWQRWRRSRLLGEPDMSGMWGRDGRPGSRPPAWEMAGRARA